MSAGFVNNWCFYLLHHEQKMMKIGLFVNCKFRVVAHYNLSGAVT